MDNGILNGQGEVELLLEYTFPNPIMTIAKTIRFHTLLEERGGMVGQME